MKLKENRKLQIVVFVVSMAMLVGIYVPVSRWIENDVVREKILSKSVSTANEVLSDITEVKEEGEVISISGWAMRLDSKVENVKVVLKPENQENLEGIVLNTQLMQSEELEDYIEYLDVENTEGKGFSAVVEKDKLQADVCYEVLAYINYEYEQEVEKTEDANHVDGTGEVLYETIEGTVKLSTKQYLFNGELYEYNPLEFVAPVFADEQMKQVVEQGRLMGYTMEHGAWVYLHEGSLYWVLDKSIASNLNEELYMFFHLNTPHTELLPEWRQQYGGDNKDFRFKINELVVDMNDNYRVAAAELGEEYPVTYISTGHYDRISGHNLWSVRFRVQMNEEIK